MKTTAMIRGRIDALNLYHTIDRDKQIEVLFAAKDRIERLEGEIDALITKARNGTLDKEDLTRAQKLIDAQE